jgi:hypothetical protein
MLNRTQGKGLKMHMGETARIAAALEQWSRFGYGVEASRIMRVAADLLLAQQVRLASAEDAIDYWRQRFREAEAVQ